MTSPRVFLLGAGPGDPELITRRAARRLAEADLVLYDALVHPDVLALARVDAEKVFVGKRAGRIYERQESIHERIRVAVAEGKTVARLKGGDPYLFGRGSEEAEFLAQTGIAFEVVPGVPSPVAASAYAGLSLTHRRSSSSIAFVTATESADKDATAHDWTKLATATDTVVFFMGLRRLESLMQTLLFHGRAPQTPVAVVEKASLPEQRTVVGTVATIARLCAEHAVSTPALTIVGDVVRHRPALRWFDTQPLFGARVLVTRPQGQEEGLVQLLRDRGAAALALPVLRIVPPTDPGAFLDAMAHLDRYGWTVFTSSNGVDAFFDALDESGRDARALGASRIACIGPATAARLRAHGLRADLIPPEFRGEAVATSILAAMGEARPRVLLPRAEVARDALPAMLRAARVPVDVVAAYRTVGPEPAQAETIASALREKRVDVITFTSPSSVERLVEVAGSASALAGFVTASIGPVTSEAAQALGVRIDVTARTYTALGLVEALEEHVRAEGHRFGRDVDA